MPELLLALLDRPETAASVLDVAGQVAGRLGLSRLRALVIRHPSTEGIMPTEEVASDADLVARAAAETARIAAIRAVYDRWIGAGGSGEWAERLGETEPLVAEATEGGATIVVGHAPGAERDARQAMAVALFESRLPSLFVPKGAAGPVGRVIAIAWKPSAAAERAVTAAMPLLCKAEQVVVLTGEEGAGTAEPPGGEPPGALLAPLRAAGVPISMRRFAPGTRPIGAALLQEAHAAGADLLVMGAFTHARWRELLLGGATRQILREADLPVLMKH
ncbi:universal stress protein [Acidisoma sp. C75]